MHLAERGGVQTPHYPGLGQLAWMSEARCAEYDPDYSDGLFFPQGSGNRPPAERREREAVRCCLLCPVRLQCLDYALSPNLIRTGPVVGIWAGTTEGERHAVKELSPAEKRARLDEFARAKAPAVLARWEGPAAGAESLQERF